MAEELQQPVPSEAALQCIARLHAEVGHAQRGGQHRDVVRLDLVEPDAHLEVGVQPPAAGRRGVEREHRDAAPEQLLQPLGRVTGLGGGLPAVLAVHVEHQVDGGAALQDAREQDAREEALAGTALAEHAVGALHELFEVQTDARVLHVQRTADPYVAGVLAAEDGGYVIVGGAVGVREVRRHRARRAAAPRRPRSS